MTDSELKLMLEKQEALLLKLLEFSQRQFAESDAVALDGLLKQKDRYFDELQELDPLLKKWHKQYKRPLGAVEQKLDENMKNDFFATHVNFRLPIQTALRFKNYFIRLPTF